MTDSVTTSPPSTDMINKVKGLPMHIIYPGLGIFLFISLFISRFSVDLKFLQTIQTSGNISLWDASSIFRWIWLLAAIALVAHYLYSKYVPARFIVSGLIVLSFINMFILKPSTGVNAVIDSTISISPTFWAYLSLIVMIAVLAIDYIQSHNKGLSFFTEAFEEAKEKVSNIEIPQPRETHSPVNNQETDSPSVSAKEPVAEHEIPVNNEEPLLKNDIKENKETI